MLLFKRLYHIAVFVGFFGAFQAQTEFQSMFDFGQNNVSYRPYLQNIYSGSYQRENYKIEAGLQFDWISRNPYTLSGIDIAGSGDFTIKNFPFTAKSYFLLNRFSPVLFETNWGIKGETKVLEHMVIELGLNFRSYQLKSWYKEEFGVDQSNRNLKENFGLTYNLTANIKPHDHYWNLGFSVTNIDYFTINQSTNPVFNLKGHYDLNENWSFMLQAWYMQAGMLNIYAGYFGYFFRTGVKYTL